MNESGKEHALAEEIMADARRQGERKLASARRTVEHIIKSANTQILAAEQETLRTAEQQLKHQTQRILADVPHQKQVRQLQTQNEVISRLFVESLETLKSCDSSALVGMLVRLSSSAIALMDGARFALELSSEDAEKLGGPLAEKTAAELRKTTGREMKIEAVASPELLGVSGVIIKSLDPPGQMVDNSFATRMRRTRESLRNRIAEMIF